MKDVLVDPLQSRLFACNGYVWLRLDPCFIDLASNAELANSFHT